LKAEVISELQDVEHAKDIVDLLRFMMGTPLVDHAQGVG
jgi:hypothetical protein